MKPLRTTLRLGARRAHESSRALLAVGLAASVLASSTLATVAYEPEARAQIDLKTQGTEAKARLAAADKASKASEWETAFKEYTASQAALPSVAAQIGIANSLYQLRRLPESYEAYDEILKTQGKTLSKAQKTQVESRLREIGQSTGNLSIRVSETGAEVTVDGKVIGTTPVAALMRVATGTHKVQVTKEGFLPFEQAADVAPNAKAIVEVNLQREPKTGHVAVKEKTGQAVRVSIDGVDVGPAPHEADLPPGSHEFGGKSATLTAPTQVVEVVRGKTYEVELAASPYIARLEVRTSDGKGFILLDGKPVAEGTFAADVAVGPHVLAVSREGYERYEKRVTLADKQTLAETITLKQTGGSGSSGEVTQERSFEGFYGGINFAANFMPSGSGNTVEDACDTLGATSCDKGSPVGGGINGYIGYSFNPIGFELFLGGMADLTRPKAHFDGVKGSDINPLVATPARDEEFTFLRGGGFAALRVRASVQSKRLRFSAAGGVGLAYKYMAMERTTTAADGSGARNVTTDKGDGYVSPGVSLDLSLQIRVSGPIAIAIGAQGWVENAGKNVRTPLKGDERLGVLDPGTTVVPSPLATPEYDMARGAQIFIGPYIGLQFGP